jgi:regulator of protease activity HflC (stomatin/prohibitin superfamily)
MDTFTTLILAASGITVSTVAARAVWRHYVVTTVVPMNHRCIHSRKGKLVGLLESGEYRFYGNGHEFQNFDQRLQQVTLQTQELTTREGITVKTTAVGLYRIVDPLMATSATADFTATLYTLIQLAMRDAINGIDAESLLSNVRTLGPELLGVVQPKAAGLGLELTELVVRDVILPADIKAALSESWRSKKSALAELETARGKAAAARTMANAAKLYDANPALLKVRYIEALEQASKGMGNTFVIGMPDEKSLKLI